ncbi:unnamed protein product [Cercopithifilaria johnstoni]|uniref:Uncharacterized protein n=1 Tax=Cercopithifilaria johnstoni TaxID=2874296 RepID=A0A8J2MI28_9BILA|nr:unnamed protein product [Cercopithifilaria johnstoni]
MISSVLVLYTVLIAQGVQAWWYGGGYGYHPFGGYGGYGGYGYGGYGGMPYYSPYHHYDMYSAHRGAQIGAAIGTLASTFGKKK